MRPLRHWNCIVARWCTKHMVGFLAEAVRAELALLRKRREFYLIPARVPSHNRGWWTTALMTAMMSRQKRKREKEREKKAETGEIYIIYALFLRWKLGDRSIRKKGCRCCDNWDNCATAMYFCIAVNGRYSVTRILCGSFRLCFLVARESMLRGWRRIVAANGKGVTKSDSWSR